MQVASPGLSRYPEHPRGSTEERPSTGEMGQAQGTRQCLAKQRTDKGLLCIPTLHFISFLDLKSSTQLECLIMLAIKTYTRKADFSKSEANAQGKGRHGLRRTKSQLLSLPPGIHSQTSATPHPATLRPEKQRSGAGGG